MRRRVWRFSLFGTTRARLRLTCIAGLVLVGRAAEARGQTPSGGQPTRLLDFTTDEGTWMSLDVSPDGTTIVFELLGDLYVLPIGGGVGRPLITGSAFQSEPKYSPDGKWLAFVSDQSGSDNVWIARADGSQAKQVTTVPRANMTAPTWTADGRAILVTMIGATAMRIAEIWRAEIATGTTTRLVENAAGPWSPLVSTPAPGPYGASVTPDGAACYYALITPRVYGSREGGKSRLIRRDLATGREEAISVDGTNPAKPAVSPNGKWLAFIAFQAGQVGLKVRDLGTGWEQWLAHPLDADDLEAAATRDVVPRYAFTPDGQSIVFTARGKFHRVDIGSAVQREIPFEARVQQTIRQPLRFPRRLEEGPVRARFVQQPARGTAGRLAFSALARIFVLDGKPGARPRRLTSAVNPREFMPAWSPDGRWIAYVTWASDGGRLWKAPADGKSAPILLVADTAFYADPVWSPDGRRIVFLVAPEYSARNERGLIPPDARLVWVSSLGGPPTAIAPAGGLRRPHFGPDGSRILAFGPGGLTSIRWDGGDRHVVVSIPADPGVGFGPPSPGEALLSPDGRYLALLRGGRLIRVALPPGRVPDSAAIAPDLATPAGLVAADAPEGFAWSADGKRLTWVTGAVLHTAAVAQPAASDSAPVVVEVARAEPSGSVLLRGARAITMRGNEVIENADILIRGNRIEAIGPRGRVPSSPEAHLVDLTGTTVIPGLVDIHGHLDVKDGLLEPEGPAFHANLAYGVTTVRDPQTIPVVFAYADLAEAGEMPSPRIFSTGPGLFTTLNFQSLAEVKTTIARYRDRYRTWLLKSYAVGNRQQRQWVIEASNDMQMMPTAEGLADTKADLTHAMDGMSGNEHSLPAVPLYRDVVELFATSGITYTPTLLVSFGGALTITKVLQEERPFDNPKLRRFFPPEPLYQRSATRMLWFPESAYRYREQAAGAAAIFRAGGHVALGGHGEMQGIQNQWEIRLLAAALSPAEVLRVATIEGATAIGLGADLGSLEPGKMADLVILEANPLADIRAVERVRSVIKNGVLYDGATLDRVWPNPRPLPAPWWRRLGGPTPH